MTGNILQTNQVFGVSNDTIETYVERKQVDDLFIDGLTRNKHIIVYGASKQGKTSLTNKHLKPDQFIRVNCSHNSMLDEVKHLTREVKRMTVKAVEIVRKIIDRHYYEE